MNHHLKVNLEMRMPSKSKDQLRTASTKGLPSHLKETEQLPGWQTPPQGLAYPERQCVSLQWALVSHGSKEKAVSQSQGPAVLGSTVQYEHPEAN